MGFSISNLKSERLTPEGKPVEPNAKKGVKWACLAAISILALAILGAFLVTALALSISHFVAGVGIFAGVCLLGSALVNALPFAYITAIADQCVKNAKHHCRKTTSMPPVTVTPYPVPTQRQY